MLNKRPIIIAAVVFVILLVPLIAMQFTNEVNWGRMDFVVAAALLFGAVAFLELAMRVVKKKSHGIVLIAVFLLTFVLIWAELAVGIFGTPFAGS